MKSTGAILAACAAAAAVLAHDTSSSSSSDPLLHHQHLHANPGHCHSPMLQSFPLLSNPICANDTLTTKYEAGARGTPHPVWTRASSCTANVNGTDEFCIFSSGTFARGRGITVITSPARANHFAQLPAFDTRTSEAVLRDENRDVLVEKDGADAGAGAGGKKPPFVMQRVAGKGWGVVATRPIYRGEHLMSFTPAIAIDYGAFDGLAVDEMRALQAEAIDQLPEDLRGKFMELSTHDGASEHLEKVDKILKTNAFDVNIYDGNEYGLYVVFPEVSRFNHDCRPNTDYWFDRTTLVQHVYATRPIYPGEEISVTYMDPLEPRARRQNKLHRVWGFQCSCALCSLRPALSAASDQRIKQINNIKKQLTDYSPGSPATPAMADLLVSLFQQERLDGAIYEAYAFAAIEWNGVGEVWEAVRYARLSLEYGLAAVGPQDQDVVEMQAIAEDPYGHWSWMLRTKKRMGWEKMRDLTRSRGRFEADY